jgi:hypothetical protein
MSTQRSDSNKIITAEITAAVARILSFPQESLIIQPVSGGYSLNRRSLIGHDGSWAFVKEVDVHLLTNEGKDELWWLKKDYLLTEVLRKMVPELVPEWARLEVDGRALIMTSYREEDGWIWTPPTDPAIQTAYIQAVVDANKKLETVSFDSDTVHALKLQPFFRDELASGGSFDTIIDDDGIKNQLIEKYEGFLTDETRPLNAQYTAMIALLSNREHMQQVSKYAANLVAQPNTVFGHCDVRSDNLTYNPATNEVKLVDWNWASFVTKGFGSSEFLIDMARRGADVTPWLHELNPEMLAATVGFYAKHCLSNPHGLDVSSKIMQSESAAIAYQLFILTTENQ